MSLLNQIPQATNDKKGWPWTEEVNPTAYDKNVNWPKISIVTPSFNQGHFIEETIRSILLQNYPNLEYIIIDGGSTDNTVETLKKYDQWITFWLSEGDKGQSDAINKGISKASGELFNWLNSDDYYLPEALKKVAEYFLKNKDIEIVTGKEYLMLNDEFTLTKGSTVKDSQEETIFHAHIDQPPSFFKTKSVREVGGVSDNLHFLMDAELWLKYLLMYEQKTILKVDDVFNVFRLHETSKTISLNEKFTLEKSFLRYLYLKKTGVSKLLLERVFDVHLFDKYMQNESSFDWKITIDKNIVENAKFHILKYYAVLAYMDHNYQLSKEIIKQFSGSFVLKDKTLLVLIIKLYSLPKNFLNFIRNAKNN